MNTAAALQARVTAVTIRTWCRTGVVAAVKLAGRWKVNAASLARRIAIGARKTPVTLQKAAAMSEYPYAQAEFLRVDFCVRVHRFDNARDMPSEVFRRAFTSAELASGKVNSKFTDITRAACETALADAGWTITGDWGPARRGTSIIATVTHN
jgi:hypothetical protein